MDVPKPVQPQNALQKSRQTRTLAITGGKGGVGKTTVALNLAIALSEQGWKVLLLDADTDLANVSIMVGAYPRQTLADVVAGRCAMQDVIITTHGGLDVIPGASGVQACMDLTEQGSLKVLRSLHDLESRYDFVLVDTASGLQAITLHMIAASELACLVVTPDPSSLTDAFSLLKVLKRRGYRRTPAVIVNMAQGASQARSVYQRFNAACQRHLQLSLHYLGALWRDETLRQSVLDQVPVTALPESDPSCHQFHSLAEMLNVHVGGSPPQKASIAAYWHRASRRSSASAAGEPSGSGPVKSTGQQCHELITKLEQVITSARGDAMLCYEAFGRLFALLGSTPDADTVEIVQTGLAAMNWDGLEDHDRAKLARHLRHLADELSPIPLEPVAPPLDLKPLKEPMYDRISFGEQDQLVRALREKPADVRLEDLLTALAGKGR
ncbi:MinD/ParA family ATP-binding protein [Marinobacter daepoensis]|uniref:MinD/ParA family ATP-binding protein n=1 Tax=Marinobacter daepoensis TaxID=262077 RepID=UPI00041B5DBD|nr:AAA family ATPase [Marinobacter daepoensis]